MNTINSGVFLNGINSEDDLCGIVKHIYELMYNYLD